MSDKIEVLDHGELHKLMARMAFTLYAEKAGWTTVDGRAMHPWDEQPEDRKEAWGAAVAWAPGRLPIYYYGGDVCVPIDQEGDDMAVIFNLTKGKTQEVLLAAFIEDCQLLEYGDDDEALRGSQRLRDYSGRGGERGPAHGVLQIHRLQRLERRRERPGARRSGQRTVRSVV